MLYPFTAPSSPITPAPASRFELYTLHSVVDGASSKQATHACLHPWIWWWLFQHTCLTGALEGHKERKNWNKPPMTCWSKQEHSGLWLYSLTSPWEGLRLLWGYKGHFAVENMRGEMPSFSSTVCEIVLSETHLQNGICCTPTSTEEACRCINSTERGIRYFHTYSKSAVLWPKLV